MTKKLYSLFFLLLFIGGIQVISAQGIPEVLWYKFDEAGGNQTENLAVPGRGSAFADVLGALTMGSSGQFGSALIGAGGSSSSNYVNTGWITDIGTSNWTISMWVNNFPPGTTTGYFFGDNTTGGWRCFTGGVAGEYGIMMRLGVVGGSDITVPGVGPGPSVLTFVYDSSVPTVHAYINGSLVLSQPQAGALNIVGTAAMTVGGYSSLNSLPAGLLMDEFRFYERALDAAEVALMWNDPLPVELTSFTASVFGNNVKLNWETSTEINNYGFSVERSSGEAFETIGFVPGYGTTSEPMSYSFTDENLKSGIYSYRLKQVDFDGSFEYSNVVEVEVIAPAEYSLSQNYPNPFNPSTNINFSIGKEGNVKLILYNLIGDEVAVLIDEYKNAGAYNYTFNAESGNRRIASGVYYYKLISNEFVETRKMMFLK